MSLYSILLFINQNAGLLVFSVISLTTMFLMIKATLQQRDRPIRSSEPIQSIQNIAATQPISDIQPIPYIQPIRQIRQIRQRNIIKPKLDSISEFKPKFIDYPSKIFYAKPNAKPIENEEYIDIDKVKPGSVTPSILKLNESKAFTSIQRGNGIYEHQIDENMNMNMNRNHNGSFNEELEVEQVFQNELDATNYPQFDYLDGYNELNAEQKKFLSAIKNNDLSCIKQMSRNCQLIYNDISFGENQVIRECTLENRLNILKYLKQTFINEIDLNCESGYCLRWCARKGFINIINWLLYEQKYQQIDISFFQYQSIEWSIIYKHKNIAKLLQKYYKEYELNKKWNILNNSERDLGVDFDIFNLPSIYQEVIDKIIRCDDTNNQQNIELIQEYYDYGLDLQFQNNMPWMVSCDCSNIPVLQFLYKIIGVDPLCLDHYLLKTACDLKDIGMLQFAKTIIRFDIWRVKIEPKLHEYKALCNNDTLFVKELENYHMPTTPIKRRRGESEHYEVPASPIPFVANSEYVRQKYGILTRSKRKMLVKKGILLD